MQNDTDYLTHFVETQTPCVFAKFGDGEEAAARGRSGQNCDGTRYSAALGAALRAAFPVLAAAPNAMIGKWHDASSAHFWEAMCPTPVSWAHYHTVLVDRDIPLADQLSKAALYRAIREFPSTKVYVANASMRPAVDLFAIDTHVVIDPVDWFDRSFDAVLSQTLGAVPAERACLVLVSAGMGAKPLMARLVEARPRALLVDVGSGWDALCRGKRSRDYQHEPHEIRDFVHQALAR